MILSADPTVVRKAAAFVEAVEKIERDFGVRLGVADAPVTFKAEEWSSPFGLMRTPGDEARLALVFPEPTPAGPRFPIHGRD